MNDTALYVSLGHNSSAVLARDNRVIRGYEQERIDRKKSSSAYPKDAIELCLPAHSFADVAYVSHWFDQFSLQDTKYLDLNHLRSKVDRVVSLTPDFTHHDAHAQSALSFYMNNSNAGRRDYIDVIVIDGFGNRQECLSVYCANYVLFGMPTPRLTHRTYGYHMSLGLMYQYATEYLGLRPNRDEYKLLGYESRILGYVTRAHAERVNLLVTRAAQHHAHRMLESTEQPAAANDWLIDLTALKAAKAKWIRQADDWRRLFPDIIDENGVRACVAFCAQTFLEECVMELIAMLIPHDFRRRLILTGGSFYNVKLNRRIQRGTRHKVFSHPLAGDQGAALGHTANLMASDLTWGTRDIGLRQGLPPGVYYVDPNEWVDAAAAELEAGRIVNVVRRGMEYGPRALCHTTTFAWPSPRNVGIINSLNERDEAMPMAPVVSRDVAFELFEQDELRLISPSDRFMITTVKWKRPPSEEMMGVAHPDPLDRSVWTARPQVVDSTSDEAALLATLDASCLINTSFNYHGEPIVFTEDDACRTHEMQLLRAQTLGLEPPVTMLVRNT